ncbi:hypothetical protein MSP8886_02496 [Marinomonas spartinae]|uniref:DUF2938 domain-containing protein n=1 Tax=Marinomonas spartinae TaxID=1792290 RepID=A0A1A8TIN3_9GAMM|nr:DUF2938 domain-containing protein [Marinomonas spartinae]SBS32622.1 hypothetical protein MSP8886_02496 [Marinomonas spartinae]
MNEIVWIIFIGVGATIVMDLWALTRQFFFGIPVNYDFLGRWIGAMRNGRLLHQNIATSPPIKSERTLGWTAHYLTGILFSALLIVIWGSEWLNRPTLIPALLVGVATVTLPFLVMQPCMGAGIAASKTPRPTITRIHSLAIHTVFGLGLYGSGWLSHLLQN